MAAIFAHTRDGKPESDWHPLEDHLKETAERCAAFSRRFGQAAGFSAGLLHDFGKFQPAVQRYLKESHAGCEDITRAPHAAAGAMWAWQQQQLPLALAIEAHHGGLKSLASLERKLEDEKDSLRRMEAAAAQAPEWIKQHPIAAPPKGAGAMWVRFLFSALIDADSLDTEKFHTGSERPRCALGLGDLLAKVEAELDSKAREADSAMNRLRREVQDAARLAADLAPGAFRLTVPTGGGKTLASLLFALRHAVKWGLERVIVVIPYTSIIDQTVKVYRDILGDDAVLEHHSNLDPAAERIENRLAAENWDRPVVVTTSVQFLETLFANHKRRLRKLHRAAGSVIVLDEVQTLPLTLLSATKYGLRQLWEGFGASVVYCTATQPLLIDREEAREIVAEPARLFEASQNRVQVIWPADIQAPTSWSAITERILAEPEGRVLAIVNKRQDAIDLAARLGEECIHLSGLMCAEHRRSKLAEIRRRLKEGSRCTVVSTQLVEAGVDLDFPVVYRALSGYDSLAQAAGRCNREGDLPGSGQLHVFVPESTEPFYLKKRTASTRTLLELGRRDLFDPAAYGEYFEELMRGIGPDSKGIMSLEKAKDFPEVAAKFVLIEDGQTEPVVAPWGDWEQKVEALRSGVTADRLRALQPFTVSLYRKEIERLSEVGAIEPLTPWRDEARSWCIVGERAMLVYDDRNGFGAAVLNRAANLNLFVD